MFEGGPAADYAQIDPLSLEENHMVIQSEGFYTAEAAIWVMEHMGRMNSDVEIKRTQQEFTCPARHRIDHAPEGHRQQYEDSANPIHIRIGALLLGDVALTQSSGEAYTLIGDGVKKNSNYKNTVFVTHTNNVKGPVGV